MAFKMIKAALLILVLTLCVCLKSYAKIMKFEEPRSAQKNVKAVQIDEGHLIDCVDINSQPSLDHPLLKDHKIQLRPSAFPLDHEKSSPIIGPNKPFLESAWSRKETCPVGTVPIYRATKYQKIRAKYLANQMHFHGNGHSPNSPVSKNINNNSHEILIKMNKTENVMYYGAVGSSSVYNLSLKSGQISTANIWIESGPLDKFNYLIAGWIVSPSLNGDSLPRLFVYWTADGANKTGCLNIICKGFVQIDPRIAPKTRLSPVSTIGGKTYDMKFLIYQDPITGNWWFVVSEQNVMVGYWPKEIVPYLTKGATDVAWGGISISGNDGISPPMGSGEYPDGFYDRAAYFRNIHYLREGLKQISVLDNDTNVEEAIVDTSGCFKLQNDKLTTSDYWGYRFAFGGPGGSIVSTSYKNFPFFFLVEIASVCPLRF